MIKKRFISMLVLLLMAVTGAMAEPITVTWTSSNGSFDNRVQYSGYGPYYNESSQEWQIYDKGTFTTNLGNFTQIQISGGYFDNYGADGWNDRTWTGNASSVYMNAYVTSAYGNDNFTITFTIEPPTVAVTGITLDKTSAEMTVGGETLTLTATVAPDDAADKTVTWTSSDETVATVTDGVVTAVAAGTATITVTTTDGAKTATCAVTVAAPAASTYTVTLKEGTDDATSWTIAPAEATTTGVAAGTEVKATYGGTKKVKSVKAVKKAPSVPSYDNTLNINTYDPELNNWENVTVPTGKHWLITGTGEATTNIIIIEDNATVTLSGVNITAWDRSITCDGNATIILADGTTNNLYHAEGRAAGIEMRGGSGTSLTIQGNTGVLNITSGSGPAIGAGNDYADCAINIEGGIINATSTDGPGIGAGYETACGNITISGGTVAATGGYGCPGIGGAYSANCGDITITSNVTSVTATKGSEAPYSIGASSSGSCGTVTIGGNEGAITTSPYTYDPSASTARTAAEATAEDLGKVVGADGNIYDDAAAATAASTTAVAMIAYVGNDAETSTTYNHGLALALGDVSDKKNWCSQTEATCLGTGHQFDSEAGAKGDMAGIDNTDYLIDHAPAGHAHDAASAARGYNSGTHPAGTSAWFLPSAGQWDKMAAAAGSYANLIANAGLKGGWDAAYWSSTEGGAGFAWFFDSSQGKLDGYSKDEGFWVRACLAF